MKMLQTTNDSVPQKHAARDGYRSIGFSQSELLRTHSNMVRRIAWHVYARMSTSVELEDLIQTGLMALIECAATYEDRGFAFATYASTRVRGAMIDQLRKEARMTRSAMAGRRKLSETRAKLQQQLMRPPSGIEMAGALDVDIETYNQMLASAVPVESDSVDELYSDHDPWFADSAEAADVTIENDQMRTLLAASIAELPVREAMILQLFFVEELNLEEIGQTLGVGAARVCQIKKTALQKLRMQMQPSIGD
jgi:RNA polymerase sigma factor FliA